MRQSIVTKFHGPAGKRSSRISATACAGRVYVQYEHGLSLDKNHIAAAQALANKYEWRGEWHMGGLPSGDRVFVALNSFPEDTFKTEGKN
jgi:hypothetical protein